MKSLHPLTFALALLATIFLTLLASPAAAREQTAARALQSIERDFDRQGLEPNVSFVREDGSERPGVRCATRSVDDFEQQFIRSAVGEHLRSAGTSHRAAMTEIPVHFHILRKGSGVWDVSDAQIAEQLDILNRSFGPHGFSFRLDGISRRSKAKFAKKCLSERIEERFKKRYAVDPATTLNIYSCRPTDGVLGYAYLPSDFPEDSYIHGVVLLHSSFPGGSAAPFDLGDTAVHEVGHYLGLLHTFQGKCGKKGDRISDTPREKSPASGCPVGRDTCSAAGLDPIHNFMDYTDDACIDEFTPEQGLWMKDQVDAFKPTLGGS